MIDAQATSTHPSHGEQRQQQQEGMMLEASTMAAAGASLDNSACILQVGAVGP
jgi:hypothetical protein